MPKKEGALGVDEEQETSAYVNVSGGVSEVPETRVVLGREAVEKTLAFPHISSLVAVAANFASSEGGGQLSPQQVREKIYQNLDLPEVGVNLSVFEDRLELMRLLSGQTGREIRRELTAFSRVKDHALDGMVAVEYLREQDRFHAFLNALLHGKISPGSLNSPLISEELKALLKNPEALYERILTEQIITTMSPLRKVRKSTNTFC